MRKKWSMEIRCNLDVWHFLMPPCSSCVLYGGLEEAPSVNAIAFLTVYDDSCKAPLELLWCWSGLSLWCAPEYRVKACVKVDRHYVNLAKSYCQMARAWWPTEKFAFWFLQKFQAVRLHHRLFWDLLSASVRLDGTSPCLFTLKVAQHYQVFD